MNHEVNIIQIESRKARNIMRGVIGSEKSYRVVEALKKIRKSCGSGNGRKALEILRGNELYEKNTVSRYFSSFCLSGIPWVEDYNASEIIKCINAHGDKIEILLGLYKSLIDAIQVCDFEKALFICDDIVINEGVSCFFIRMLFLIKIRSEQVLKCKEVSKKIDAIYIKINITNFQYIYDVIWELSNENTDYFNICNKVNANKNENSECYIAKNFTDHVIREKHVFIKTLNSYFLFSLVDAFLFYANTRRYNVSYTKYFNAIDKELIKKFDAIRHVHASMALYPDKKEKCMDTRFFREAFLFIESESCFKYRTIHAALYNGREDKKEVRVSSESGNINKYYRDVKSLADICTETGNEYHVYFEKYNIRNCNFLENTNALMFYIEKYDADINGEEDRFVKLMSHTMGVGYICPVHYLHKIKRNATTDELKLVVECLISIKDRSQISEHSLRRLIQDIVVTKYNSNLLDMLDYLSNVSFSVTEHLIQICDETFLSKMFRIVDKPNQAIIKRAEILEWFGEKTKEDDYIKRAKNLRIDIQINKEKGMIDDSRIYVDPLKFTQWVSDNVLNDITYILENAQTKINLQKVAFDWESVKTGITKAEQLGALIQKSYVEFCNNKLFGIASYLGRRIRHGTFKGTAINELKEVVNEKQYSVLVNDRAFHDKYENWLLSYESMIDDLKESYLHINSKTKPKGLIKPDFKSKSKAKTAHVLIVDIVSSYLKHKSNEQIPVLILEYCWRIVEEDLVHIRKILMESKSKYAVFNCDLGYLDKKKKKVIQECCKDLNSVVTDKFRTIESWFSKPSFASPSADLDLLFTAVLSEVRGLFPGFKPTVVLSDGNYAITGGLYFVIYDALYILIYNAAKYGKYDGELEFNKQYDDANKRFEISLLSEISETSTISECQKLIENALSSDFEDAHIIEGKSGIKKLKRLENDGYISAVKYRCCSNKVTASFNYSLDY
jgi:hypothetical protein